MRPTASALGPFVRFARSAFFTAFVCSGVFGAASAGCGDPARPVAPVAPVETVAIPAAPVSSTPSLIVAPPGPSETEARRARDTDSTDGNQVYGQPTSIDADPTANASTNGNCTPFDRGAAARALGAVNVQSCKRPGGPTGAGHGKITYEPATGRVSAVTLDSGPFPGTAEGACIVVRFRAASVPPFCRGASVAVGKSFALQ